MAQLSAPTCPAMTRSYLDGGGEPDPTSLRGIVQDGDVAYRRRRYPWFAFARDLAYSPRCNTG